MKLNYAYVVFWLIGIIWGSNFIYMKMASDYLQSDQIVFVRVLFGFLPVFFYALYLKVIKLEHLKYAHHFFVMSLIGTSIYYYYYVKASSLIPSSISGVLSGSIPLFTFLIALIFIKEEKTNLRKIIGIFFALFGIILISKPFEVNLTNTNYEGIFDILFGSFIVASSFVYAKKFLVPLKIHFAALTTYQLGFALLTFSFITDYSNFSVILNDTHSLIGLILGLGLLGTGVTFIGYYYLIEHIGAVKASTATYIPPIVALNIGYFLVDEKLGFIDLIATGLIIFGLVLVNKKEKILISE